ncbi:hypothetical protein BN439_3981 [Erwinia amylovora Ea644]|nr:hypothetical protein BN439_3981 [Erwinia amylovora Ea644]
MILGSGSRQSESSGAAGQPVKQLNPGEFAGFSAWSERAFPGAI